MAADPYQTAAEFQLSQVPCSRFTTGLFIETLMKLPETKLLKLPAGILVILAFAGIFNQPPKRLRVDLLPCLTAPV